MANAMPTPRRTALLLLVRAAAAAPGGAAGPTGADPCLRSAVFALALREPAPGAAAPSSLAALLAALRGALGPRAGAERGASLLAELEALDSPDALVALFQGLPGELLKHGEELPRGATEEPPPQSADDSLRLPLGSALGLFVRECCAAFDLLSFEGVGRLWEAVRRYRRSPEEPPFPASPLRPALPHSYHRFLAREGRGSGLRLLEEDDLSRLPLPDHPRAHLLSYRGHQRRRNHSRALAALHAHYDCTGGREAPLRPAPSALGHFHFAALAQCTALAEQGRRGAALRALEETIRVAQQAGDSTCLTHALAQLCRLALEPLAAPSSLLGLGFLSVLERRQNALRLLRRCLRRSRELKLPHLEAFACLALAQFHMLHSSRPLDTPDHAGLGVPAACEHITLLRRETALAAALATGAEDGGAGEPPGSSADPPGESPPGDATAAAGTSAGAGSGNGDAQALKSGVGSAKAALEGSASTAHLLRSSFEDLAGRPSAALSLFEAHAEAFGGADEDAAAAASVGAALLAEALGAAPAGRFSSPHRGPYNARARAGELASRHRALCLAGDFRGARHLAAQMGALHHSGSGGGVAAAAQAEAALLAAAVQLGLGRPAEAASAAGGLFARCHAAGLQLEALRALLLVAAARREGGHPEAAVPYALSALTQSRAKGFGALEAECHVFLAELWLGFGPTCAPLAQSHLAQCLRSVLSDAHAELRARALMAAARAALWEARADGRAPEPRVLSMLEGAAQAWEALQAHGRAAEAHRLRALAFNEAGDAARRDAAAACFRRDAARAAAAR